MEQQRGRRRSGSGAADEVRAERAESGAGQLQLQGNGRGEGGATELRRHRRADHLLSSSEAQQSSAAAQPCRPSVQGTAVERKSGARWREGMGSRAEMCDAFGSPSRGDPTFRCPGLRRCSCHPRLHHIHLPLSLTIYRCRRRRSTPLASLCSPPRDASLPLSLCCESRGTGAQRRLPTHRRGQWQSAVQRRLCRAARGLSGVVLLAPSAVTSASACASPCLCSLSSPILHPLLSAERCPELCWCVAAAAMSSSSSSSPSSADDASAASQLTSLRATSPNVLFLIARSKNLNLVVYEAKLTSSGALDPSDPVTVYWLDIDPEYQKANRAKGISSDRVELGSIERRLAYGLSSTPVQGRSGEYQVRLVAFPDRVVTVSVDPATKRPVARMLIAGSQCQLERIYVTATEHWLNPMPTVNHVDVTGVDGTGKRVTERIIPK